MKKRIGSVLLALALCLSLLPATALAEDGTDASVSIGSTALVSGKYYVKASDTTTGEPASTRVVDAQDTAPESGPYLEFDGNTLTVYGYVNLESAGPAALSVNSGSLTVTGEASAQLSLSNSSAYAVQVSSSASLRLTGLFSFEASTQGSSPGAIAIAALGSLSTENYSGNFTVTGKAGAITSNGTLSVVTNGTILLRRDIADSMFPVVYAQELTLQGSAVTVTGGGTLLSSGGDINVTSTEADLTLSSNSTTQSVLKANGTITLSAPDKISLTSTFSGGSFDSYAISGNKLVLNNAKTATLKSTGKLMGSVTQQIDSHVGKLTITQEGKTTVIENGASVTYDGDITTAGLDFSSDLPTAQATYLAGDGTAVFTPATSESAATLTLSNATAGNIKLGANAVNIVVEGENTVGQITANGVDINISGSGSLTATTLQSANNAVKVQLDSALTLNGGYNTMLSGAIDITAATVTFNGTHGVYTNNKTVSVTATTGDIRFNGSANMSGYLLGSDVQNAVFSAPNGSIICNEGSLNSAATLRAKNDISFSKSDSSAIVQNALTAESETGNISIMNSNSYGYAAQSYNGTDVIDLSAPNGKITVSGTKGAIVNNGGGSVTINAKEVELTSSDQYASTLKTASLNLSGDKVTIIGSASAQSNPQGYPVVYANGTIQSDDLLIYATSSNGYAIAPTNDTGVLQLTGTGLVIGNLAKDHVTHDDAITVVASASEKISSDSLENALTGSSKTALSAGGGFVLVDPTEKTLLLHDVTIQPSGSGYTAVTVPDGVTTATIEGTLTISTLNSIDLSGCESVVFKPGALLKIEEDGHLYLPNSVTLEDLEKLDLSCGGIIILIDKDAQTSSHVIRVTYALDGGTNAPSNPSLYLKSTKDENTVALAAPTKSGYDFKGWYTDAAYENKLEALTKDIDTDAKLTLYAKWEKSQLSGPSSGSSSSRPSYSITVPNKPENGSVTVSPTSAKQGSTVTITVTPDAGYVLDKLTVTDKDGKDVALTKKSDTEYTFVMPAGKVEITPSFVKQAEEPSRVFVDVKTGDYFYDAVLWAVGKGITNGTSDETFSPEDPCTRAQIVTFLWRAAGSPVVNYAMDLTDVAGDAYYAEAVRWALSEGITTGTSDNTFSPDATCTREQAVTFLWRAAGSPAVSGGSAFADVAADAYYACAVAWAAQNGVTNGISKDLFGTGSDCTRAQIVTFLYRAQQGK